MRGSLASFFESGLRLNPSESLPPPDKMLDSAHWELASELALWIAERRVIKDGLRGILALFLMVGFVDCQEEGEGMRNLTQAPVVPLELTANTRPGNCLPSSRLPSLFYPLSA